MTVTALVAWCWCWYSGTHYRPREQWPVSPAQPSPAQPSVPIMTMVMMMMVSPHAVPGPGHDNNTQCSARTCVPTLHRPHRPARPCPAHLPYKVTWAGLLGSPHSNAHFPSPAQMCSTMGWWQPPTVGTLAPSPAQHSQAQPTFPFTVVFSDTGSSSRASAVLPRVTFLPNTVIRSSQGQPGPAAK